jgi:Mrp family chromosome partitioning ATPase
MSSYPIAAEEAGIYVPREASRMPSPQGRPRPGPQVRPLPPPDLDAAPRADFTTANRLSDVAMPSWARPEVVASCNDALSALGGIALTSIGVTSVANGEGRSTVAAGFAVVERCSYGRRTILLELDLERPSLAATLGLRTGPGVAEIVRGEASIDECLQWPLPDLGVLVAGEVGDAPGALLADVASTGLVQRVRAVTDVVVSDLPALSNDLAARVAQTHRDVVLVVKAGGVPRAKVKRAAARLPIAPAVILNQHVPIKPTWLDGMLGSGR